MVDAAGEVSRPCLCGGTIWRDMSGSLFSSQVLAFGGNWELASAHRYVRLGSANNVQVEVYVFLCSFGLVVARVVLLSCVAVCVCLTQSVFRYPFLPTTPSMSTNSTVQHRDEKIALDTNKTGEQEGGDTTRDLLTAQDGQDRCDAEDATTSRSMHDPVVVETNSERMRGADDALEGGALNSKADTTRDLGGDRAGLGLFEYTRPPTTRPDEEMSDESKVSIIGAVAGALAGAEAGAARGAYVGGGADSGALSGSIKGAYAGARAGAQAAERAGLFWLIKQGAIAGTVAGTAAGAVSGATEAAARQGVVGAVVTSQYCDAAAAGTKVGCTITRIAASAALCPCCRFERRNSEQGGRRLHKDGGDGRWGPETTADNQL
jgi:hypothetical protein